MPINQVDPSVAGGQGDGSNVDFNGELDELEQMLNNDDYGDEPSKSEKLLEQLQHEIGG
jgi:hypothetical protein